MLRRALLWLRTSFVSIPLIIFGTIVATIAGMIVRLALPQCGVVGRIKQGWARWVLGAAFTRITIIGRENIPTGAAVVYCANHLSYLDPPALVVALGGGPRFLAKSSLFRIPLFGWAMRLEGDLAIERDSPRRAARSLARAVEAMRRGISFVVFPEGGRSRDGRLQPFHSGAFRLAIRARAPVVPLAIRGSERALRPGSLLIRGGPIHVVIGQAIPTEGMAPGSQRVLAARVEAAIREML